MSRRRTDTATLPMRDHDLLIEIKTKLEAFGETLARAANQSDVADHERRIRDLESKVWKAVGAIAFMQLLATILSVVALVRSLG